MGMMTAAQPPPVLWLRCFRQEQELLLGRRRRIASAISR